MRKNFLWGLVGLLAGLFVMERERRKELSAQVMQSMTAKDVPPPAPPERKSRTREELVPEPARDKESWYTFRDIAQLTDSLRATAREMVRPDMTPDEAKIVGDEWASWVGQLMFYHSGREMRDQQRDSNANRWIDEIEEGKTDDE